MKKVLFISLLAIFSFALNAQDSKIALEPSKAEKVCSNDSFTGFTAKFTYSDIVGYDVNTEKGIFTAIDIDGTYPSGNDGDPQLLVDRQMIAIPVGATPFVTVKSYTEEVYNLSEYGMHKIMPRQPSVSKSANLDEVKFIYNEDAYNTKGFVGKDMVEVEVAGNLRGVHFGFINIRPIVYDASTNVIKVRNNIEIEVKFEGGDKAATQNLFKVTYSPYFNAFYSKLFNRNVYDDHPDIYQNPVHMLVIADRMFEEVMQPWLEWKTKKGFYLNVNYTDEIGTSYNQIQQFVKNTYNEGLNTGEVPVFVVLFGDIAQIPATNGSNTHEVTDLYFGSIDGDIYPEMYASRLCCETTTQMASLIEKTLVYEQYTMEDPSYLNNVLLIAGHDYSWTPKVGKPTIEYAMQYYYNTEHGYENVHSYLSQPYTGCYSYLSSGVAHAHYTAHGSNTSWADPSFSVSDVNNLTNEGKYFLAIGNCCIAADYAYNPVCFGEAMIRANKKGAYAYIGASPSTYWNEDYYWAVGAHNTPYGQVPTYDGSSMGSFDAMFMEDAFNTVSSTNFAGLLAVSYSHEGSYPTHSNPTYYWQAYNILGDGSIMPYLTEPEENNVSHSQIIYIGFDTYTVSADPNSLVAISKDGEIFGTALVGESGTVDVEITPITSSGTVDLVVTCPQRIPYITELIAQAAEGPYLTLDSYTLGGDGILSYGETTDLSLIIKNVGVDPTNSESTVTISCDSDQITINNATATCNALSPDQTFTVSGFNFTVANDIEDGQLFTFNVSISNAKETWETTLRVKAFKPILSFDRFEWEGGFEPNSTINLNVCYANTGGFKVSDVTVNLTSTNSNITISPNTVSLGQIDPEGTGCATFVINVGNVEETDILEFETTASGDNGLITAESTFTLSNSCNVVFYLTDSYGDGWNGGGNLDIMFDDGTPTVNITVPSGSSVFEKILNITTGTEVTLKYNSGSWDTENGIKVYYEDDPDNIIYQVTGPSSGVLFTFICECAATLIQPISNLDLEIINDNNVQLTWTHPNVDNIASFIIYRDGTEIGVTDELTYLDENVPGGAHTYCVVAVTSDGQESMQVCQNISIVNGDCNQIENLQATVDGNVVTLTWQAGNGGDEPSEEITEGFEGESLPEGWTINSLDAITWEHVGTIEFSSGPVIPHEGEKQMNCHWSFGDQDEWLISPEFTMPTGATLTFWTYLTLGSTNGDHYYVKVSTDGGTTWTEVWDGSTEPAGPNHYDAAINVDLSTYGGQDVKVAWHAYAIGGMWYSWFIDDVTIASSNEVLSFNGRDIVREPVVVSITDVRDSFSRLGKGRSVILSEDFEGGAISSDWTQIDADGDGNMWMISPVSHGTGANCVTSESYINYVGALTPDNYLITPELSLPEGGTLTYWVCAQDGAYPYDHYGIFYSTTGNGVNDFNTTPLFEETLTAKHVGPKGDRGTNDLGTWYERTVELPAGTKYVAFRHFNCTDAFRVNIDEVVISTEGGNIDPPTDVTFNIYRDGALIATTTSFEYVDEDLNEGTYEYCVEVVCSENNVSDQVCTEATVGGDLCNPVRNLEGEVDDNVVILTWDYPEGYAAPQEETLSWSGAFDNNAIGTNGAADFDVAHRFEVSDLTDYVGWKLTKITFYPYEQFCDYSLRAWTGTNAANMVLDQPVSDVVIGGENTVAVETDVTIEANQEFWIGYRCNATAGFPAGVDAGPAVTGKGDMIKFDGVWDNISGMGLSYNFAIVGTIVSSKGEVANITINDAPNRVFEGELAITNRPSIAPSLAIKEQTKRTRGLLGYKIFLEGEEIATIDDPAVNYFTDLHPNIFKDYDVEYCVQAIYSTCESENVCESVTITGIEGNSNLSVYPNPANSIVNIDGVSVEKVYVYNNIGQLVEMLSSNQVNVSSYVKGVYMFNIVSVDGEVHKVKVVVQ
ncbi:MAG: C25 family cysteine peptidase [Bacteroidales bacterium]